MRQRKLTDQQRLDAVTAYLVGAGNYQAVAEQFNISARTLRDFVALYQHHGPDALKCSETNNHYPVDLKRQAVAEYQAGHGSQRDICFKYKIRSRTLLRDWIRQYGDTAPPETAKASGRTAGSQDHAASRKTSFDERINIVCHCLANNKDYALSAGVYKVSYKQVYSWVRKYEAQGLDGLLDKRGRQPNLAAMTPLERAEYENKLLQAKIAHLETEVLALKKLRDLERRWG